MPTDRRGPAPLRPGRKSRLMLNVRRTGLAMPVTAVAGAAPGPSVLAAAGVHGAEDAGLLALIELGREIEPARLRGRLTLIHPINISGFLARRATVLPEDGVNINSVFPGRADGAPAERVAHAVAKMQAQADFFLDLHTAGPFEETCALACYPAVGPPGVAEKSRAAAQALDLPYLIKSTLPGAALVEGARRGGPGLLIKRGGPGGLNLRPTVDAFKRDVLNILRHLDLLSEPPTPPAQPPREVDVTYLRAPAPGLWLAEIAAGTEVAAGQRLGVLADLFGRPRETFRAERDGLVLYRQHSLAAAPGDILAAY